MLSTQLIILNYPVILSHQCSTTVSLETNPLYSTVKLSTGIELTERKVFPEGEVHKPRTKPVCAVNVFRHSLRGKLHKRT